MGRGARYFDENGFRTHSPVGTAQSLLTACEQAGRTYELNAKEKSERFKDRYSILKRSIYQLGQEYSKRRTLGALVQRVYQANIDAGEGRAIPMNAPSPEENPFYSLYYLALGSRSENLSRQEREKACKQLLYANRHGVPVEFLIGFIGQCGSYTELRKKLRAGEREHWWEWRRDS